MERVTDTGVYAIEGNTSVTSDDNGGAVMRRFRPWRQIMAVGRPKYSNEEAEDDMNEADIRRLVDAAVEAKAEEIAQRVTANVTRVLDTAISKLRADLKPREYSRVDELPEWAQRPVKSLVEAKVVQGDGAGEIHLTQLDLVPVTVSARVLERAVAMLAPQG